MNWLFEAEIWIGLLTLTALEIVLGIDNIVFISVLSGRLPAAGGPAQKCASLGVDVGNAYAHPSAALSLLDHGFDPSDFFSV
jgi:hypothetical protein